MKLENELQLIFKGVVKMDGIDKFVKIFSIDSAMSAAEIEDTIVDGEHGYRLPYENSEYKYFLVEKGIILISKDGEHWSIPISITSNGKRYRPTDFLMLSNSIN